MAESKVDPRKVFRLDGGIMVVVKNGRLVLPESLQMTDVTDSNKVVQYPQDLEAWLRIIYQADYFGVMPDILELLDEESEEYRIIHMLLDEKLGAKAKLNCR